MSDERGMEYGNSTLVCDLAHSNNYEIVRLADDYASRPVLTLCHN